MIIRIGNISRFRIRPGKEAATPGNTLKPGTTAIVIGAGHPHPPHPTVTLFVNPAIVWEGTEAELYEHWEPVPDSTPLTF